MSNSKKPGIVSLFFLILQIVLPIWVGYQTYLWMAPKGFGSILLWLVVWAVVSTIVYRLLVAIAGFITK